MKTLWKAIALVGMITLCCGGCKILDGDKSMKEMDDAMEANLNDDLNATERKAVDPIFEKGEKERERDERAVIGFPE